LLAGSSNDLEWVTEDRGAHILDTIHELLARKFRRKLKVIGEKELGSDYLELLNGEIASKATKCT